MNRDEAIKATRNGAIAALISAAVTIIFVLVAIGTDADDRLALWNDPFNFIDVALVLACAFGMYKKSRAASVVVFIYFLLAKIIIAVETERYAGIAMGLVFLYFFARAIQGSFVYHRLERENNPDYKSSTKWAYIVGIPCGVIFLALIGIGLMTMTGVLPSTKVQSTNEVFTSDIVTLKNEGIISAEDKIRYFYSQGTSSILESGNILTQDRVILYFTDETGELLLYEIFLDEIKTVALESQGNFFEPSIYRVTTEDPDAWLELVLSTEEDGDKKFVAAVRDGISK